MQSDHALLVETILLSLKFFFYSVFRFEDSLSSNLVFPFNLAYDFVHFLETIALYFYLLIHKLVNYFEHVGFLIFLKFFTELRDLFY